MENTKIIVSNTVGKNYSSDLCVYLVPQKDKERPDSSGIENTYLSKAIKNKDFTGKYNEILLYYPDKPKKNDLKSKRFAFAGIGKIDSKFKNTELHENVRLSGGEIAKLAKKIRAGRICIDTTTLNHSSVLHVISLIIEGMLLGDYSFTKYKTVDKNKADFTGISEIKVLSKGTYQSDLRKSLQDVKKICDSVHLARDMANEPGNKLTSHAFAEIAKKIGKRKGIRCTILEKKDLEKLEMGGILAVNKGSHIPPNLIILEKNNSNSQKKIMLVGKGLTFDSGGISLKPAAGMEDMKYDMCGGAAVLAAMNYISLNKNPVNVVALIPVTDNMSGSDALKPGDIITHYNKLTSEIINTDAEGRLILADALAYGKEIFSPDYIVDLATLTGAVVIGLGHHYSGLVSNDDQLSKELIEAGKKISEPVWRLPNGKAYEKQLESKVADIKNIGGRPGGTITAAEYLRKFVGDTPWAHLDIAGTAWSFTEKSYITPNGPSGICVRLLIEFINEL